MDGEVLQKAMVGKRHSRVVARLIHLLMQYAERTGASIDVDTELRHLRREDEWVFLPDVSVTRSARLADLDESSAAPVEVLPDFAIEVLSPDDRPGQVAQKIARYMQAGVPLLWVVDPDAQQVTAWTPAGSPETVGSDGILDASPVLDGFEVEASRLFEA